MVSTGLHLRSKWSGECLLNILNRLGYNEYYESIISRQMLNVENAFHAQSLEHFQFDVISEQRQSNIR